jgi:hypothetical protein
MAILSFPSGPVPGQIYADPGLPAYRFNGEGWDCIGLTSTAPTIVTSYTFAHGVIDPVDSTTYYIGDYPDLQPSSLPNQSFAIVSQVNGFIDSLAQTISVIGATSDSTEHSTIEIHNLTQGTSVIAASEVHYSSDGAQYNHESLSLSVSTGDLLQIRWITPIWIDNPTRVRQRFTLKINNI